MEFNDLYKNVTSFLTEAEKLVETGIACFGWDQLELNVIAFKSVECETVSVVFTE